MHIWGLPMPQSSYRNVVYIHCRIYLRYELVLFHFYGNGLIFYNDRSF